MRNLKRALSLLLAAAMLIGMMVVGASAASSLDDFPDKDEIVNQDAVSLLTILGVIEGKGDGSFYDPTGNVTRAEMAKMIATILNQGADVAGLYTGMNTGLTDVSGHWAESYINYCYSLGIIAGRGDGTFDPGATVTGTEAAKMLLVAAGYDASIEGLTGADWAIRTAALASTLGIFDNLTAPTGDPLNRDNAALLVYNALDIEMIQRYENGYAIVYSDYRTLLSNRYGVYRLQGVVVGNEWARLETTGTDAALAEGKTKLNELRLIESDTVSTRPDMGGNNNLDGEYLDPTIFNVSTPVEYLGQTVTLYVRNTTVLANSEVLGVYLKDDVNTVLTTAENQDEMDDYLRGTGLSTDSDTAYYVNYGYMGDSINGENASTESMSFEEVSPSRFESVNGNVNAYGVEMTVIDNDEDGMVDYVLYLQETLSHVVTEDTADETTTLSGFNSNRAINDEDIVTEAEMAVGDLVLAVTYGGRYYVSDPEVVTGEMEAYTANKAKEQTITVNGTDYHPSFIQYEAYTADNTYEFNILDCDTDDGVQFDIEYNFILDSNGNVIAYQPSEQGLYDYALVLDSAYDPGLFASSANGQVKVLLPDGTEKTFDLNFDASADNLADQLDPNNTITGSTRDLMGVQQLKGFLGTAYDDNTESRPWRSTAIGGITTGFAYQDINDNGGTIDKEDYRTGQAKGYVIGYSLNADETELTITSIVGSTRPLNGVTAITSDIDGQVGDNGNATTDRSYDNGDGRLYWWDTAQRNSAIDLNTVAFYYTYEDTAPGSVDRTADTYGVAVGYSEMTDVAEDVNVVGNNVRNTGNLAATVLFEAEGVEAEKEYVYVLGLARVDRDGNSVMNVVYMNGDLGQITIDASDYRSIFDDESKFEMAYAYTTDADGITELTEPTFAGNVSTNLQVVYGYAWDLKNGTIDVYSDVRKNSPIGSYSFDSQTVWNVENEDGDTEGTAARGSFSEYVGSEVVIVTNLSDTSARAVFIRDTLDGIYGSNFTVNITDDGATGITTAGGPVASLTSTTPARPTGAVDEYKWEVSTDGGSTWTSLIGNANYTGADTASLSVNSGVLTNGQAIQYRLEITRTEAGRLPTVATSAAEIFTVGNVSNDLTGSNYMVSEIQDALNAGGNVTLDGSLDGDLFNSTAKTLTIGRNQKLTITGNFDATSVTITNLGELEVTGILTMNAGGSDNLTGKISAGTLNAGADSRAIVGDVTVGTLTGSTGTLTVNSGSLTVSGTNSYSGTITNAGGTVSLPTATTLNTSAGTTTVTGNVATLSVSGGTANVGGNVTTSASVTGGVANLTGTAAAVTVDGGTANLSGGVTTLTMTSGDAAVKASLTVGTLTYTAGTVAVDAGQHLTITNASSAAGYEAITGGTASQLTLTADSSDITTNTAVNNAYFLTTAGDAATIGTIDTTSIDSGTIKAGTYTWYPIYEDGAGTTTRSAWALSET